MKIHYYKYYWSIIIIFIITIIIIIIVIIIIIFIIIERYASMKTSLWHFPCWLYTNDNAGASFILQL